MAKRVSLEAKLHPVETKCDSVRDRRNNNVTIWCRKPNGAAFVSRSCRRLTGFFSPPGITSGTTQFVTRPVSSRPQMTRKPNNTGPAAMREFPISKLHGRFKRDPLPRPVSRPSSLQLRIDHSLLHRKSNPITMLARTRTRTARWVNKFVSLREIRPSRGTSIRSGRIRRESCGCLKRGSKDEEV